MRDLYSVLEVPRSASADDIRRAYKRLALKNHPDKNPNDAAAAERFKEVSNAYEVLSDEAKRRLYDAGGMDAVERGSAAPPEPAFGQARSEARAGQFRGGGGGRRPEDFMFSHEDFYGDDFGHPHGGQRAQHGHQSHHHSRHHFAFSDPFEIFAAMFGAAHPFADDPFFGGGAPRGAQHRSAGRTGAARAPQDPFEAMMGGMFGGGMFGGGIFGGGPSAMLMHDGFGSGGSSMMFSSSSFGGGPGGGQSVSQSTTIRNGRKVTKTVRRYQHPDGTVHEDVDEQIEELPSHGAARPLPSTQQQYQHQQQQQSYHHHPPQRAALPSTLPPVPPMSHSSRREHEPQRRSSGTYHNQAPTAQHWGTAHHDTRGAVPTATTTGSRRTHGYGYGY